jgi:hypothetical protein
MQFVRQITFERVKGYATYERAVKRGEEVAAMLQQAFPNNKGVVSWVVVPGMPGRWVPAFNVTHVPGGPGFFLSLTNVCTFN